MVKTENVAEVSCLVDKDIKKKAEAVLEDIGYSMNFAINEFLKKIGEEKDIPFEVNDPFYSESNMRYLNKVIDDIESGKRPLVKHDLIEV